MEEKVIIVEGQQGRIDKFVSQQIPQLSRSRVAQLCQDGLITVNGEKVKSSFKVSEGMQILVCIPDDEPVDILPENIPLDILYEDQDIIVINKPKGMVVHPAVGNYSGTLVNALLYHCQDLSGINGVIRPGIVHRIDKDTTGCIVACKNDQAHIKISAQLENKTCHREYVALVMGDIVQSDGLIDAPIGRDPNDRQKMKVQEANAKQAVTHFHVLERFGNMTYLACTLETGRTHQIRVHMKFIQHPIVGDEKYGKPCALMNTHGQVLHAQSLTLIHPTTGQEMTFHAPLPAYFEELLTRLRKES